VNTAPQIYRSCLAARTPASTPIRRTDKQAIAFEQHVAEPYRLNGSHRGAFETIYAMEWAIALNRVADKGGRP
jgi:hypothetical protein